MISRIDREEKEESSGDLEDEVTPEDKPEQRKPQEQSLLSKQVELWGPPDGINMIVDMMRWLAVTRCRSCSACGGNRLQPVVSRLSESLTVFWSDTESAGRYSVRDSEAFVPGMIYFSPSLYSIPSRRKLESIEMGNLQT